jgi:hypothetical protein
VFQLSSFGCIVSFIIFVGYLCLAVVLHGVGVYMPPFQVLNFSDPIFTMLGFLTGGLICLLSGTLTLLTLFLETKGTNSGFVILLSLIAFGFGAATLRITAGPLQDHLASVVSM